MPSPAIIVTSADEEDGTDGVHKSCVVDVIQPVISQEDAESLIENLQSQAENISYEIEKIVGVHKDDDDENNKTLYRVRLVAYSWLPEDCLGSFQHLIDDFLQSVQDQPHVASQVSVQDQPHVASQVPTSVVVDSEITSTELDVTEQDIARQDVTVTEQDIACQDISKTSDEEEDDEEDEEDDDDDDDDDDNQVEKTPIIKQENFQADNPDVFPLPTAFMVTIGSGDTTGANIEDIVVTEKSNSNALHCEKCHQRFFLKSNLEVHVLFCKGDRSMLAKSPTTEGVEVTVNTEEVDSSFTSVSNRQLSIFSEDQTFEYVPLESDCTDCTTCAQRLPEGAMVGDSLADLAQLVSHSRMKESGDDIEIYECDECDREFLYKYPMKKTPASWLEKNLNTPIFPTKKRKIRHDRPFRCSICNRGFENESEQANHEKRHSITQSRYSCASCGEKFMTRNAMQNHYDANPKCQPTKCELCGRTFVHSSHLKRHLSIHAGIKPFICYICGHEFNQRSDLQRHEKKHTLNDTYVCLKCQQAFDTVDMLKEHIDTHKSEEESKKVYACSRCDKVFGRKSHYKRHVTIHEGMKPHACTKCGKCFNQRTDLKRHEHSHDRKELKVLTHSLSVKKNENNAHTCVVCSKVFTSRSAFIEHDVVHQKIMTSEKIMSSGVMY